MTIKVQAWSRLAVIPCVAATLALTPAIAAGPEQKRTNDGAAAWGVAAIVGAVALCALFCKSGSSSQSPGTASSDSGMRAWEMQHQKEEQARQDAEAAAVRGSPSTSGFYGNCHGGSFYGC